MTHPEITDDATERNRATGQPARAGSEGHDTVGRRFCGRSKPQQPTVIEGLGRDGIAKGHEWSIIPRIQNDTDQATDPAPGLIRLSIPTQDYEAKK